MRGSIRSQSKNSWQITVDIGRSKNGKRLRHFETVRGRKTDAQRTLSELLVKFEKGTYASPGRLTVKEHLNNWVDGYVKTNCSQRTLDGYRSIVENHLVPGLGHIMLRQLSPRVIQEYYGKTITKLSSRTVNHHHRVLSQSLKHAIRQGYLGHNPCDLVDAPSPKRNVMRTMTAAEVETLFEAAKNSIYYAVIYTAISTGLRQAELLGLRWRDVDLDLLSISVNQVLYKRRCICTFKEPKTTHSRRQIAMTPKLAIFLRQYRDAQDKFYQVLGKILSLDDLIFTSPEGKAIDPSVLSHAFHTLVDHAGLKGVRFHDLRHTFASLMLLRGAKPKVISELLGHASVAFTMDTYSHIITGMQEDAMKLLDGVLPPGEFSNSYVAKMS